MAIRSLQQGGWPFSAAMFPIIVGVPGFFLAATLALKIALHGQDNPKESQTRSGTPGDLYLDEELLRGEGLKRTIITFAWILGLFFWSWPLGQRIALPLFVFLYLKVGSKEGWMISIAVTLAVAIFLLGIFDQVVHASWYQEKLFRRIGLEPF